MLVFVDVPNASIKVYSEKGVDSFEFDEVDDLAKIIGKKKVQWVTDIIPVTAAQIVETINGLIAQGAGNTAFDGMDSQTYYLQSNKNGILHVQDINVTFEGPGDCRLLDEEMYACVQESAVLRNLLKEKIISIVDYATMKKAARKQERQKSKFQKLRKDSKDKDLDDILIKSDRPGSALDLAAGMFSGGSEDDVKTTDITDSIIHDPEIEMSEEEYARAVKAGRFAP